MWGRGPAPQPDASPRAAMRIRGGARSVYNSPREVSRGKSMFFNRKEATGRRGAALAAAPAAALSPRFARLVRESWWLLVVAAFVWLALILATYSRSRSRLVVLGHRRADRQQGRRRRRVARRSAALPVRALRVVVGRRPASCWSSPAIRRIGHPELATDHPLSLGVLGFALVLLTSAALEALRLYRLPATLPQAPGGALGDVVGRGLVDARSASTARRCCCSRSSPSAASLFFGMSWLKLMERVGAGLERLGRARAAPRRASAGTASSARRRSPCARRSSRRSTRSSSASRSSSCRRRSRCRSPSASSRRSSGRCSSTCRIRRCRRSRCSTTRRRRRRR